MSDSPQPSLTHNELIALAECLHAIDNGVASGHSGGVSARIVKAQISVGDEVVVVEYDEAGDFAFTGWAS